MSDGFYRAFEDRFRGSRGLIKGRLRVYLPFIEPLKAYYPDASTIDLGCGRGEWLELLQENGFRPMGFDLDDGMLEACQELGLLAEHCDAIEGLKILADESQIVVSGFHIAEHLPFDILKNLVKEALRVLKPGGLLILETPNPENLTVGTSSFYFDPTHLQPIPPPLLAFLAEYYGFKNVKIIRLHDSDHLQLEQCVTLQDVLGGVSPDFAIIAQKEADESIMSATRGAFEKEYGVSAEMLSSRFNRQSESRAQQAETKAAQAETVAQQAETTAQQAETKAQQAETMAQQAGQRAQLTEARSAELEAALEVTRKEMHDVHQSNHHHLQLVEARDEQIQALLNSTSWRVMAPLRWLVTLARKPVRLKSRGRSYGKDLVGHLMLYLVRRPGLKKLAIQVLKPFPTLKACLREKRAAQIRSDFKNHSMNATGGLEYALNDHRQETRVVLSQIISSDKPLTVDEILERIRGELVEPKAEK